MQRMLYYHVISWCSWQFWKCLVLSVFIWEYHLRFELVSSHHYFDSGVQIAHVSRHFDKGCMSSELSVIGNATEKWHRHPEIMSKIKSKSQLAGLLDLCGAWASSEHSDDSQSSPQWSGVKETIDHLYHLLNQWYLFCFVISYFPHTNDLTHEDLPSSRKRDGWLEMASKHKLLCLKSSIFALHPPSVPRLK